MAFLLLKPLRKRLGSDRDYYRMLDDIFGLYPNNIELYKLALIHRSASLSVNGRVINNERLEFLGDAILEGVVSDYLFIEFPGGDEGFLTKMRARIVSRATLDALAVSMGLDKYIRSRFPGGCANKHVHGDAMEAMIGAIYLDKGYDYANRLLINRIFRRHLDIAQLTSTDTDYKSRLIEWCQKSRRTIEFDSGFSNGSTSRKPLFKSKIFIDGEEVGYGFGETKKQAEQWASYSVSRALSDEIGDFLLQSIDMQRNDKAHL